jgi:alanine-synthesizing transaminase
MKPFPRLALLPPYVLAEVDARKRAAKARGEEVFDFGVGNPDGPSPPLAISVLSEEAQRTENHRYQPSHGLPALRQAICAWYARRYQIKLDPETEVVATIGSKEGLAHLFYAVLGPGDPVLVPDPCYPIHRVGVMFAGGQVVGVPMAPGRHHLNDYEAARAASPTPPRLAIMNFPHNPTTATVDLDYWKRAVAWAQKHDLYLISDLAYADLTFDDRETPSALLVDGARERVVEFFTVSKSYSMPGWRVGFCVGNRELVAALAKMKSYLDYGIFAPAQLAAAAVLSPAGDAVARAARENYRDRRDVLCAGLARAGWPVELPHATMFVWAPVPERMRAGGSAEFARKLFDATRVAVAPGTGFGPGGEGYVRFALVEDILRTRRATELIKGFLAQ